jgi:hypothetical protein
MSVNLEIVPSNVPSNGRVSFRDGNPLIQFIIGEQERALIGRSVRLVGNFHVQLASGAGDATYVQQASAIAPDITGGDGGGGSSNRPQWSSRLGIYNVIDQLVIKSQISHQTIEHIRHYNRFCASFIPILNSLEDSIGHLSESALIMPNFQVSYGGIMANQAQRGDGDTGTGGNAFCCHLPCGLFNGVQSVPLAGTKGLLVEIHLAPDNNVLYGQSGATDGYPNMFYELSDVRLVAEAEDYDAQSQGTFEYNSVHSYYTSINSTNAIVNFNLGLTRVLGAFANFLPAQNINNLRTDGMATSVLVGGESPLVDDPSANNTAEVKQAVFLRGGQRFPLEYNIDTIHQNANSEVVAMAQNGSVDPQLTRNFLDAVRQFSRIGRSSISTNNTFLLNNGGGADGAISQAGNFGGMDKTSPEGGLVYGVGVNYDSISGDGVDFSTQNWGVQLETGLQTDTPHAMYLFIHAKNTLVFNDGGIQVLA